MKKITYLLLGVLLALGVNAQAQGWRGSVNGNDIYYGSVAAPSVTGADLGSTTYRWDVFARNMNISGTFAFTGSLLAPDGSCTAGSVPYSFTNYTGNGMASPSGVLTLCDPDGIMALTMDSTHGVRLDVTTDAKATLLTRGGADTAIFSTLTFQGATFTNRGSGAVTIGPSNADNLIFSTGGTQRVFVDSAGIAPWINNAYANGASGTRWSNVYSVLGNFSGAVTIGNTVGAAVAVASTHKVTIDIGGTTYYLLATNVP